MNEGAYKTVPQLEMKIEQHQDATRDVSILSAESSLTFEMSTDSPLGAWFRP